MNREQETPPTQVWRWLGLAAVLLLLLSVATIAAISAGLVDPEPTGSPTARQTLDTLEVGAGEAEQAWVTRVPSGAYTVRLTAAHAGGEPDSGYGLLLGGNERQFAVALSPLGYVAVWDRIEQAEKRHIPWQPWPHVNTGTNANEIQIDVAAGKVTVRINREILWQGASAALGPNAGILLRSFGQGATVKFQTLSIYERTHEE